MTYSWSNTNTMLYNNTNMKCGLVSSNKNKICLSILSTSHSTNLPLFCWKHCSPSAARERKEAANCFLMLDVNNGNKKKHLTDQILSQSDVSSILLPALYSFLSNENLILRLCRQKTWSGDETGRTTPAGCRSALL